MALLQLERDIFGLWCRWLYRPLEGASEERAREAFAKAMEMVDGALAKVGGGGPFFLGDAISMVDIMTVPFLERQAASLLYWKGFKIRNGGYDNIDRRGAARTLHVDGLPAWLRSVFVDSAGDERGKKCFVYTKSTAA